MSIYGLYSTVKGILSALTPVATYSFSEISGAIAHYKRGSYSFDGQGIGEITISMSTDRTAHEISADGGIFITQIPGDNGSITLSIQQTSGLHSWLIEWYNYLKNEGTERSQWANTSIAIRNTSTGEIYAISGVSPTKLPERTYQTQGQRVNWVLMAGDIQHKGG